MIMSKFKRKILTVNPLLLDRLICEYISGHAPSRASVADACSVSTVTAGKVASALIECGFMDGRVFSKGEKRPSTHLLFNDRSSILIIDLSSSIYKMCVVNPGGRILLNLSHVYDPEISFDDNLNIFISRNGLKLKQSRLDFAAISVLYADDGQQNSAFLPSIKISDYIEGVIYTILGKRVTANLTVSSAIGEAVGFKAIELDNTHRGISSIFIGSSISSFHVYENGSVTVCAPESFIPREEMPDVTALRFMSKDKADILYARLSDFMAAAFAPSVLLLGSDFLSPDHETADKIYRKFILLGRPVPVIYTRDDSFPLEYIGAARHALRSVIKKYIFSDKQ